MNIKEEREETINDEIKGERNEKRKSAWNKYRNEIQLSFLYAREKK